MSGALILMYHRVNCPYADPFALSVTRQHFAEHMEMLAREAQPLSLSQLHAALRRNAVPPKSVAVTFDDGYEDNRENALPLLQRAGIPATIFIPTGQWERSREFWWDELERVFLEPGRLPEELSLEIGGTHEAWRLDNADSRQRVYHALWSRLQLLPDGERLGVLDRIAHWAGRDTVPRQEYRTLTPGELSALAAEPLIEIGAHTVTHPALPELPWEEQQREIRASRASLEQLLGRSVSGFAYPFGARSEETLAEVRQAGFEYACATFAGAVLPGADLLQLPRMHVEDWGGDDFAKRLWTWWNAAPDPALARPARRPVEVRHGKWLFRVAGENAARLSRLPEDPDGCRVAIERIASADAYDIQLNLPGLAIRAQERLKLGFRARADRPRLLRCGLAQAHEPWQGLGIYEEVKLDAKWREFEFPFVAGGDDANARIHFDLGGDATQLELTDVALSRVPSAGLVSAIIIFWNAERFLREAIESVLAQDYPEWELILADDGSTDGSSAIAREYAKRDASRIVVVEHEGHRNRGMSATRNLGIRHSRGAYLAFLDADDVWLPQKLSRQVALMEAQPEASLVCGASRYWHSWTTDPMDALRDYVQEPGVGPGLYTPPSLFHELYPFGSATTPPPSNFLLRRNLADGVGGFEESFTGIHQLFDDQAFLVKVYLRGPILVCGEVWDLYRIHPDSCVSGVGRSGHYDNVREFFLAWFGGYLRREGIRDPQIWRTYGEAVRAALTRLRVAGESEARLAHLIASTDTLQISIGKASGTTHDIQLNMPCYRLDAACRYALCFQARAAAPRSIAAGVAEAHPPWSGLGLFATVDLTTEWQPFEMEFTPETGDDNARIHFDLGASAVAVDLRGVALRHAADGRAVERSLEVPGVCP